MTVQELGAPRSIKPVEMDEEREISEAGGTIIRSHHELERLLSGQAPATTEVRAPAIDEIEKSNKILRMLTQVAKALISEDKLEGVLEKVI